ncbi:MAG: DMT family transporter [Planctomycetota bacterium]|jgi:drug/metabolite transporter (DMT)-like permease
MAETQQKSPPLVILLLLLFALIIVWAVEWLLIGISTEDIDIYTGSALRFGVAAVVIGLLIIILRIRIPLDRGSIISYLVIWLCTLMFPYLLCYWALRHIESSLTALIFTAYTFFVAVGAHFLVKGERLSFSKIIGALVCFGGLVLLFLGKMENPAIEGFWKPAHETTPRLVLLSMLAVLLATVFWAVQAIYIKLKAGHIHPLALVFIPVVLTSVSCGVISFLMRGNHANHWSQKALVCIIILAIFASAGAFFIYYYLLSKIHVSKLAMTAFVTPMVSVIFGIVFRQEWISRIGWFGVPLVIGGVILATKPWKAFQNNNSKRKVEEGSSSVSPHA